MQGLMGWLAPSGVGEDALTSALGAMKAAKPQHAEYAHYAGGWAVGVDSGTAFAHEGGLGAVILGRPEFRDPAYESVAPAIALLKLWRNHGKETPQHIHGPFALAILDQQEAAVFLAIDRVGIHSLSFAALDDGLVFGTRADVVAAHPRVGANLDPQGLFNYIYFHVVPAPGTIFKRVEKLRPAQWAHWCQGELTRGFYWRLHYEDEKRSDFAPQSARLHQVLREAVTRAKGNDDPAAFLSGGTDSSTVCGVLTEVAGKGARSYSIGFAAQDFDEMEYARLATRRFGLDAREYYLKPEDILEAIPAIAAHYDEPFGNDSAVPALFCARLAAADGYRVMLAGDGGDEIFGGNARYAKQKVFEAYHTLPGFLRRSVVEPLVHLPGCSHLPPLRKLQSYIRQANIPLPERTESYNFVNRQPLQEMLNDELLVAVDPQQPAALLTNAYDRTDSGSYINCMLHLDLEFTLADNDLRKVSGMTEAAGVEVRYPLLDEAILEFSGQVPPDWKVKGQTLRWFWKEALKGFLPDAIINKTKHGFGMPFGIWARDYAPLRERVQDRLGDFKKRGLLQPAYIDCVRKEHMSGHATYFGIMLWVILALEEWLDARRL